MTVEDIISRFPHDLHINLFSRLSRKELFQVKLVCKRWYDIVQMREIYKGRSDPGRLSVSQTYDGYIFMLSTVDHDDPKLNIRPENRLKTFIYVINNLFGEEQSFHVRRHLARGMDLNPIKHCGPSHNLEVPFRFCQAMEKLLIQYPVKDVMISRIPLNSDLLTVLATSLQKSLINKIHIEHSTCGDDAKEGVEIIRNLLKSSKTAELTVDNCPSLTECGFFDESFFVAMEGSSLRFLESKESWSSYLKNQFYPAKTILPLLTQYDGLILHSLILDAAWIGEFITMHLDKRKPSFMQAYWQMRIDKNLSAQQLQEQLKQSTDFEYALCGGMHCVVKKSNGFQANFDIVNFTVDGSPVFLLDMSFFSPLSFGGNPMVFLPCCRHIKMKQDSLKMEDSRKRKHADSSFMDLFY